MKPPMWDNLLQLKVNDQGLGAGLSDPPETSTCIHGAGGSAGYVVIGSVEEGQLKRRWMLSQSIAADKTGRREK